MQGAIRATLTRHRAPPGLAQHAWYYFAIFAAVITGLVVEPIPGDWQILDENMPHTKSSASSATWNVSAPAGGRSTLTYTARVKWCLW